MKCCVNTTGCWPSSRTGNEVISPKVSNVFSFSLFLSLSLSRLLELSLVVIYFIYFLLICSNAEKEQEIPFKKLALGPWGDVTRIKLDGDNDNDNLIPSGGEENEIRKR